MGKDLSNMDKLSTNKLRSLKRINWDYTLSPEDLFAVINGKKAKAGHWNREDLLLRMLERLSWYELLDFFTIEELALKLRPKLLARLHNKEKREKYERLGKILRKEPVSFTKWGAEYREKSRDTLFSNRWYST